MAVSSRLLPVCALGLALMGCGSSTSLGARDLSPRQARRVVVPVFRGIEPGSYGYDERQYSSLDEDQSPDPAYCEWACKLAQRPGEQVRACKIVLVNSPLDAQMGASDRNAVLCTFQ